jgi:hypothetical protein
MGACNLERTPHSVLHLCPLLAAGWGDLQEPAEHVAFADHISFRRDAFAVVWIFRCSCSSGHGGLIKTTMLSGAIS